MDILITGASGFLGGRFYQLLGKSHNVAGTYFDNEVRNMYQLDITNQSGFVNLAQNLDPDVIIHTAAISDPDACEVNQEWARGVNVDGTENAAIAAKRTGAKLVHISSSFVFGGDGRYIEDDTPTPGTVYGQTKLDAERAVRRHVDDYIILRCPKLFGVNSSNSGTELTETILRSLRETGRVELDDSTERYPVFVDDVTDITQRLLDIHARGTYHVGTQTPYTKIEFGNLVQEIFGVDGNLVPVDAESAAERPSGLELDTTKLEQIGIEMTTVKTALDTLKHQRACSFKAVYSFKPDEMIESQSASKVRVKLGKELGQDDPIDADIVVPIPESGIYPATGYADATGIPLYHGIIRDYETERTLYESNIEDRTRKLRKKLVAVDDILEGKRVVLIDEAIISGLTLTTVIQKCRNAGVESIHVRIPSPPMRSNCSYGVLAADANLIAGDGSAERDDIEAMLEDRFNLASLRFLPLDTYQETVPSDYGFSCTDCFNRC